MNGEVEGGWGLGPGGKQKPKRPLGRHAHSKGATAAAQVKSAVGKGAIGVEFPFPARPGSGPSTGVCGQDDVSQKMAYMPSFATRHCTRGGALSTPAAPTHGRRVGVGPVSGTARGMRTGGLISSHTIGSPAGAFFLVSTVPKIGSRKSARTQPDGSCLTPSRPALSVCGRERAARGRLCVVE